MRNRSKNRLRSPFGAVFRFPAWTATLTWKAAVFITLMCCGLAALLGGLVHNAMTNQTIGTAREKALDRLDRITEAYETGTRTPRGEGLDPKALPPSCARTRRPDGAAPSSANSGTSRSCGRPDPRTGTA